MPSFSDNLSNTISNGMTTISNAATLGGNFQGLSSALTSGITTGYNASLAIENLNAFKSSLDSVLSKLGAAYEKLINELRGTWASPTAQKFSQKSASFLNIIDMGRSIGNSIISSAVLSVAEMARANGSDFHYSGEVTSKSPAVCTLLNEIDGYIGIDTISVNNALLVFNTDINNALAELAEINDGIAVLDTHNNIQTLYEQRISALRKDINEKVETINNDIKKTVNDQETILKEARNKILANISAITQTLAISEENLDNYIDA